MLKVILDLNDLAMEAIKKGVRVNDIAALEVKEKIARMKYVKDIDKEAGEIAKEAGNSIKRLQSNVMEVSAKAEGGQ